MNLLKTYQRTSIKRGWTRVDLLLMLYDRAIGEIESCEIAAAAGDRTLYCKHELALRKTIMTIHAGLKPDEDEVAFNIARLLHFVMVQFDDKDYATGKKILGQIRDGFAQIADQANEMERQGTIPALPETDTFESIA
ncbi:flagellar protein FliS [Stieleria sp. ICT_E10.1]|uniref:flagellar protein FliS n=1 Tax=Stieleria sedimenti TaxID=2976331 RepID=UPI0021806AF3|nr:flagellar protein FliS [Stieleria sedimenti]MCS7469493.1 flagellar protein FliS [Stieleria sedimenti]